MMRIAIVTAALAVAACSDEAERRAAADINAAGFVPPSVTSRLDYGTAQERRFTRLDVDADDVLTSAEIPSGNRRIIELDRNGDGEITSSEFGEGTMARFDAMDLNRDGTLTSDERIESRGER
jgi:hypothetical protein